jgi:hypothetical protein
VYKKLTEEVLAEIEGVMENKPAELAKRFG